MGHHGLAVWLGFTGIVVALLVLDLGVLNRRSHVLSFKEAMSWSLGLIAFALVFGLFLWWREGAQHALEYYTGYLIELSLSVDNLFVFILIFNYFGVPSEAQPKVLKWGILGAIVMRFIMIAVGALLLAAVRVDHLRLRRDPDRDRRPDAAAEGRADRAGEEPDRPAGAAGAAVHQQLRRRQFHLPGPAPAGCSPRRWCWCSWWWSGRTWSSPSTASPPSSRSPAIPFLVYSSNVFAILGLRALFFVLAGMMDQFVYLKPGVALILVFVGGKMALSALAARAHPG